MLTDALNSKVFVKNIHNLVNEYTTDKSEEDKNKEDKNILVFDEGQRAWDKQQMFSKSSTNKSEPDVLIEHADKKLDWSVLLMLVGEGQEINTEMSSRH